MSRADERRRIVMKVDILNSKKSAFRIVDLKRMVRTFEAEGWFPNSVVIFRDGTIQVDNLRRIEPAPNAES
jgi:hypothetical protein